MAAQSTLVGYNTNVRHKGKLYHIQTEDSGVSRPHVITHLFADGGRIIASRKTGYAEHLGAKELASIVKKLMQEQHKAMFIELRDCVYDSEPPPASGPIETQPQPQAEPAQPVAAAGAPAVRAPPAPAVAQAKPPLAATAAKPRLPSVAGIPAPLGRDGHAVPPVPPAAAFGQAPAKPLQATSSPSQAGLRAPTAPLSSADIETFERAAEARLLSSILGKARIEAGRRGIGRYQQTVSAKPARAQRQPSRNIFGGEALRGKSLDEVILSYLSDDAGDTER
ncbi:MAG TPA: hypothetical protein VMF89_28765 [Polyangiales bacterium]|nr:hypothetical protein [Polyangiales bacterium]